MSDFNALAEQMGVGPLDDDRHDPRDHDARRIALTDAFIEQANLAYDAWLHARDETPEPCRGCGRTDCDSECAEYRAWLTVAWLEADTADRASQAAYAHRWGDAAGEVG